MVTLRFGVSNMFLSIFNYFYSKHVLVALLLCFWSNTCLVHSVTLDSEGYYDIVVAINEKTAQNSNADYLENLKAGIQDLSHAIFESTHKKFSIRSADIVLPSHWQIEADDFITTQNYKNADIRISHEYLVPQAINPTFCGYPGQYIELPYSFFDADGTGPFGPTGKALLMLWARYRWGVFEENGYPGDPQFPYYWKEYAAWDPEDPGKAVEEPWRYTSCFDVGVNGNYTMIETGEACGPDYVPPVVTTENPEDPNDDELYPPPSGCRFHPDMYGQSVTSSLMSFNFIQSMKEFCNEETHDKAAPSRQNLFCHYKSTREVIQQSYDWKRVGNGSVNKREPIKYRVLKETSKPLLFILSDGVYAPPEEIITTMEKKLNDIFTKIEFWNVITAAGVFPGKDMKDSFDTVYNWNTPWSKKDDLITAFKNSFASRESTMFRNFGAALQDIGTLLKDMSHSVGAVIIMVKYGAETDSYMQNQRLAYESEVLGTILPLNVRLFVIEGDEGGQETKRLENIANLTGGLHYQIGASQDENVANVNKIFSAVENILTVGKVEASKYRMVYKDSGQIDTLGAIDKNITFLVDYKNVANIMFYVESRVMYSLLGIKITSGPEGVDVDLPLDMYNQWEKSHPLFMSYKAKWSEIVKDPSEWTCNFGCDPSTGEKCYYTIVVIAELADSEEVTPQPKNEINIEVFTSADADDNIADYSVETVTSLKGTVFTIYAKLEKNGHPITNPDLEVDAHVCHFRDGHAIEDSYRPAIDCAKIPLKDDGPPAGNQDLTAYDGIFSGSFIAKHESIESDAQYRGTHQIFVTAQLKNKGGKRLQPLPVDQVDIRCGSGYQGCWTESITEPFYVHADMKRRLDFTGKEEFEFDKMAAATRIFDLRARPNPDAKDNYLLEWTNSLILREGGDFAGTEYEIVYTNNFTKLLVGEYTDRLYGANRPGQPGTTGTARVEGMKEGEKRWFMMRTLIPEAVYVPIWSNVVFIQASQRFFQTTTTTTTTTTPKPTESTTRLTTSEPVPEPTPPTTMITTTPPRQTTQVSTRIPITVTTTTERPTTEKFEATTAEAERWYTSPGAIATFSVFGVIMTAMIGGVLTYVRIINARASMFEV